VIKKKFNKGDRVYMNGKGYGTVTTPTYNNIHFSTYTCVKWDDYLGQKFALAEDTDDLTLVKSDGRIII
jgi:hypothetical protein